MQVEQSLGAIQLSDEKTEPNPQLAQHFIDLLAMLQEKTKGNLELSEKRLLENSLTELRFRFVQASEELAKKA